MHSPSDQPIVFMFSGQGSQSYQMGKTLFQENRVFRHWMQTADKLVQQWLLVSLLDELFDPNKSMTTPFSETLFTHPAIFAVQYAMTQVLESQGIRPHLVLGASLGEFAAATVAGAISFEQAMELICLQAQILDTHCTHSGGMLAVLAPESLYQSTPLMHDNTALAAVNAEQHFVISGTRSKLQQVERYLAEKQVICQSLPVRHGFHSPLIDSLAGSYMPVLKRNTYRSPGIPLVFCSRAGPVGTVTAASFWNSIRSPIRIRETLLGMESRGSYRYLDVGPSGTLANFAKLNYQPDSASSSLACLTPFGDSLHQLDSVVSTLSRPRLHRPSV